jgi:hypothetical protein
MLRSSKVHLAFDRTTKSLSKANDGPAHSDSSTSIAFRHIHRSEWPLLWEVF